MKQCRKDASVKNLISGFPVILSKAGLLYFQQVPYPGFRRSNDFLIFYRFIRKYSYETGFTEC
jgi:hypothetical protein